MIAPMRKCPYGQRNNAIKMCIYANGRCVTLMYFFFTTLCFIKFGCFSKFAVIKK